MNFFKKIRNLSTRLRYTLVKYLLTGIFLLVSRQAEAQKLTLKVDISSTIRPVTHCASGSLYGMTQTLPSNIADLVAPLNPLEFALPPRTGTGNQHDNGAAAISVANRLSSIKTARIQVYLPDLLPNWPYKWPGKSSWLSQVTSFINDKKASDVSNIYAYNVWNEPNGTWAASNGDFYAECWVPTYKLIRSMDSGAKIIGPGDAYYSRVRISEFLSYCKKNDCLPDIMCWHELQGCANISSHVKDYRSLEKELGISELPITINEYCHTDKPKEGCPGTSAPFIAKFERNKIESACISWWFTALPGRLGSLLTANNEKGGGWWFYKWYGDMTGNMVSVTPPNDNSDGIDGFACFDPDSGYAGICLGGNNTGMVDVVVSGIPSTLGDNVNVKVEYVPWTNKDTPVSGIAVVSTKTYTVSDGTITVPVNVTSQFYGYRVYLTPHSSVRTARCQRTAPGSGQVNIHPAAGSRLLHVSLPDLPANEAIVYIFNSAGRLVKRERISGRYGDIRVSMLASGSYTAEIEYNGSFFTRNFNLKQ